MKLSKNWGRLVMKYKFIDICSKIGSGATPRGGKEAYCAEGITLIRSQNVLDFKMSYDGLVYINDEQAKKLNNVEVQKGDILLNITGDSVARCCIVNCDLLPARVNQHVAIIRGKNNFVLNNYLLYFLQYNKKYLLQLASSGATRNALTKNMIENLEIDLPALEEQQKIASILSALDDQIEVNQKINENLEQQVQTIFKSWFVDFEPFGGVMPKDWKIGVISDLAKDIICGKTPSTKKSEFYGTEIPFITIPDMHNSIYITQTERYLSKLGAESQKGKMLPKNSICVSCIGTAGLVSLVCSQSQTNQQINSIIPKEEISPYYIFLLIKTLSKTIQNLGSGGSTICNLNKNQFSNIEIMLPTNEVNKKFDEKVSCMFEKIKQNQIENNVLAKLRDTLLPKLMNGEIDVGGVEL